MLDKTQVTRVAVAGFGAAMASVFAIPEAHATIIPISFSPGSVAYSARSGTAGTRAAVNFNTATSGAYVLGVAVLNDRSHKILSVGNYSSLRSAVFGATISAASFAGTHKLSTGGYAGGTAYVGFRTDGGGAGWFAVNWGGAGGAIKFIKGAVNTDEGGSIVVGQMPAGVPEPSELGLMALGLLALGAAGVRMRREARKAAELN